MALSEAGTWEAQVAVPVGTSPGVWLPVLVAVDTAGNSTTVRLDGDTSPGAEIEVNGPGDSVAPLLLGLRLDRHSVDTRRHSAVIQATARVRAGLALTKRVTVIAVAGRRFVSMPLHRARGSAGGSTWLGPRCASRPGSATAGGRCGSSWWTGSATCGSTPPPTWPPWAAAPRRPVVRGQEPGRPEAAHGHGADVHAAVGRREHR